ncbi:MAG: TraR/DksA C4-type zinc finger protein [Flavobacteriales bacterium]|nr:TraR/DksA C4-type zinc finger protein [Flavobacteriales bacterium]
MNKEQKEELKEKLTRELEKVKTEIEELRELTKPIAPENAIGRISRMDAINNKSVNEAALRKKEERMKKLLYAQTKIDEGNFGKCLRCKNDIPFGRILLMPESTRCVNCAQ